MLNTTQASSILNSQMTMNSKRRATSIDQDEILAYKKQKIRQELQERRLLQDILSLPANKRSAHEQSELFKILLSFPCF